MLRKKIVAGGLCVLGISTANAGLYAGAGLGPDTIDFKQKAHVVYFNPAFPAQGFNVRDETHLSGTGVFGTLFAGYGYHYHNRSYLAGEVNGNISSTVFNASNREAIHGTHSSNHYKINNTFGVSLLPGFQFTPDTLFYGRVGYTNAGFKVSTSDSSLQNVDKRKDGFRWGLGGKRAISERMALRMEFSQSNYGSTTLRTLDPLSNVSKSTKISPMQQLVEFALVYNFDSVQVA